MDVTSQSVRVLARQAQDVHKKSTNLNQNKTSQNTLLHTRSLGRGCVDVDRTYTILIMLCLTLEGAGGHRR